MISWLWHDCMMCIQDCAINTVRGLNCYLQDGIGEFFADTDTKLYWVSFLDGMQRILLFTDDIAVATVAQQVNHRCYFIDVVLNIIEVIV